MRPTEMFLKGPKVGLSSAFDSRAAISHDDNETGRQ